MSQRWILMNPGPVNVSANVRRALLKPDICHREKEFSVVLNNIRGTLLKIFGVQKSHTVAVLTGSGTAALEAMLSSYAQKKKKVLVLSNGVYGDRILQLLKIHKAPVAVLRSKLGQFPSNESIERVLKSDRSIHGIVMVHHETSTGMLNPVYEIAKISRKHRKVFLVDAVSSLGAESLDCRMIDYCAGSAGKCLHGYPGVSFVILSKKEAKMLRGTNPRSLYLDLYNTLKYEELQDTPFTPAVQLFYAFEEALRQLKKEGLNSRIKSYAKRSNLLEDGFRALGLKFLVQPKWRSHVLTALWIPPRLSYEKLHSALKKNGFIVYAGQSNLAGKIFRVSNLGEMSLQDLRRFLGLLKKIFAS